MQQIEEFIGWFIDAIPPLLMAEPFIYFIAILIISWLVKIILSLFHVD